MKQTWQLILFGGLLATLVIYSAAFVSWSIQFVLSGLVYFISLLFLARIKHDLVKWDLILVLSPFLLLFGLATIQNVFRGQIQNIPTLLSPIVAAYLGFKFSKKFSIYTAVFLTFFTFCGYIFMDNWITYSFHKENFKPDTFPEITMIDENKQQMHLNNSGVKIIDAWSLSCTNCIDKFPIIDKLTDSYKNDDLVNFYTLNLPEIEKEYRDPEKFTKKFSFISLITYDMNSWNKLNIHATPYIFVLDKNQKIIYKGGLNTKWYHFYNNIHNIIAEAKHLD